MNTAYIIFLSVFIVTPSVFAGDSSCTGEYVIYNSGDTIENGRASSTGNRDKFAHFNEVKENTEIQLRKSGYLDINCFRYEGTGYYSGLCCTGISATKKFCNRVAKVFLREGFAPENDKIEIISKFLETCLTD